MTGRGDAGRRRRQVRHAYGVAWAAGAVIAANCDRGLWRSRAHWRRAAIEIEAIVDRRKESEVDAGARSGAVAKHVLFDSVIRAVRGARGVRGCAQDPPILRAGGP